MKRGWQFKAKMAHVQYYADLYFLKRSQGKLKKNKKTNKPKVTSNYNLSTTSGVSTTQKKKSSTKKTERQLNEKDELNHDAVVQNYDELFESKNTGPRLRSRRRKSAFSQKELKKMGIPEYDYKTFYKHGRIWKGRNPYLERVELLCELG